MTRTQILALPERDLNLAVAERVMGWREVRWRDGPITPTLLHEYESATRSQDAFTWNDCSAMRLAEHLQPLGWLVVIKLMPEGFPFRRNDDDPQEYPFRSCVSLQWMPRRDVQDSRRAIHWSPTALGDNWWEALCRAALEAVGLMEEGT